MGGKKRSRDDSYENLMRKIKKLEKKVQRRYKSEGSDSPNSSYADAQTFDGIPVEDDEVLLENVLPTNELPLPPSPPHTGSQTAVPLVTAISEVTSNQDDMHLTDDILNILGEDPSLEKTFGEELHKDIASRWKHILLNGLTKENRMELMKMYLPSENCPNMKAPRLNPEIKAALTEINNKKDVYSQSKQNQLTSCLAALGKALNIVLTKPAQIPQELLKPMSDAGRLLCDYHYKESLSRRYAAMNTLNKETRDIIKNTKIDELLFGSDLPEQLKCSKAISKSGMEMRPPVAGPSGLKNKPTVTISQPPAPRRNNTLNARGAPRTMAAEPRVNPAPRRQPAPHRHVTGSAIRPPPQRYRSRRP